MKNNKTLVSFCIPTYNQGDLAKKCAEKILEYKGDDIEVIVSDNASTDNTEELIAQIDDKRVLYFKNDHNIGLDLNIIQAFRRAHSDYAFLLITRDSIIPEKIPLIIEHIERSGSEMTYLTGNALRGDKVVITNVRDHYSRGEDALMASIKTLYVHPSGSLYNIDKINLDLLENFVRSYSADQIYAVHMLIRLQLALEGEFHLLKEPIWIYEDTLGTQRISSNVLGRNDKTPIYSPVFKKKTFYCLTNWLTILLENEQLRDRAIYEYFSQYMYDLTWGFRRQNKNQKMRNHYNCMQIKFSINKERKAFIKEIRENSFLRKIILEKYKKKTHQRIIKNILVDPVIDLLLQYGCNSDLHKFYRKYLRKYK